MGIQTIMTCDHCGLNVDGEDYATVECKFEIDRNHTDGTDVRQRFFLVLCEDCGKTYWSKIGGAS